MCQVIFRLHDATDPDPAKNAKCWKAGQAIDVIPDGALAGNMVTENNGFKVVSFLGVDHLYEDDAKDPNNAAKIAARDKIRALFGTNGEVRRTTGIDIKTWTTTDDAACESKLGTMANQTASLDTRKKVFTADSKSVSAATEA